MGMREIRRRGSGNCWCYGLGPVVMKRSPGIVDARRRRERNDTRRSPPTSKWRSSLRIRERLGGVPGLFQWHGVPGEREGVCRLALWARLAVEPLGMGRRRRRRKLETV